MKVSLVIAACTLSLCLATTAGADDQCADLIIKKCVDCHQISRVCQKVGKKSKSRWKRTIKRMIKRGTPLTKAESKEILTCLLEAKEGVRQMCE